MDESDVILGPHMHAHTLIATYISTHSKIFKQTEP